MEDTRIDTITQVVPTPRFRAIRNFLRASGARRGLLLLLLCALSLVFGASAHAEEPGTAVVNVLPADNRPRGVQVRAQTVDATLRESAGVVFADTQVMIDFYNPGPTPIAVPVTLPGPQQAPLALPEQLTATLDNQPLDLVLLPLSADQPQIQATAVVTVPMKGKAALRISYRQALPRQDGLAVFTYNLAATAAWSGKPESLRVTVKFTPEASAQHILGFTPAAPRSRRDGLTWHWENTEPAEDIGVAFIAPSWWADLEAIRQQAASAGGLAEHVALAERYWRLATLTPPPFQKEGYFERFFPNAVEALTAGIMKAGEGAVADAAAVAAAHAGLADFYQAQAERLAPEAALSYLQLAASELQAALTLEPADAATRQAAGGLQSQLLALARARGDALAAQEHEARLAALATEAGLPSEQDLARSAALAAAEEALAAGDHAAAAAEVARAFGADATALPTMPRPRLIQTRITITTTRTGRAFSLQASGDAAADAAALLAQAGQTLDAALPGDVNVEAGPKTLAFTLTYSDTAQLTAMQADAAAALADLPELALLAAALKPGQQAWQIERRPFLISERYVESVNLQPAAAGWKARAAQLAAAAEQARAADGSTIESRLGRVQAALWADDAAAWRALAGRSSVVHRVALETRAVVREWELAAHEAREIAASARNWRYDRLAGVAGGIALLLVVMIYFIWRAIRVVR